MRFWIAKLNYLEIYSSKGSASVAQFNKPLPFTAADICCNSLSVVVNHQNVFDGAVNYNVLDIDGTVKSPNQLLDARVICLTDNECNDRKLEAEQVLIYTVTLQC